ncbi:lysophospholipase L1-like esterase [Marmoricola sp. URHA0025 HA25]
MQRVRIASLAGVVVLALLLGAGFASAPVGAADPGTTARPLKIVLLGDSYSAGNGARDANGDRDYYGPKDCYRSHSNWAEQYVDHLQAEGYAVTFLNRACSGGVTDNVLHDRKMDDSGGAITLPLGGDVPTESEALAMVEDADPCNTHDYPDEEYWQYSNAFVSGAQIFYRCTRFLKAQVDAIGADTDLVLFTIGGNDIGFSDIVTQCFVPGPRSARDCEEKVNAAYGALDGVHQHVLDIVDAMRGRGLREDARVVLGGYPLLAQDNGYDLTDGIFHRYTYPVADAVRLLGQAGDQAQDGIVADANVGHPGQVIHLTGVPQLFDGHEPDGAALSRNSQRWIWELFETKIKLEWYHMNPTGHTEYASLLSQGGTYGAGAGTVGAGGDIDVVLVLDTTGSMGSSIDAVRQYATSLVDQVSSATTSARFALVTYRDQPEWTGDPSDYPSRVEQGFTSDGNVIKSALNTVTVAGGGDWPESMYSGIMAGLDLPWRPGVKKAVIVLADAPPHDPEPVTGYTADDVISRAFAVDPAEVYLVDTGDAAYGGQVGQIASTTGGSLIDANSAADVPGALITALQTALKKPYAWINGPYVAKVGSTLALDGSGSYATDGSIASYEWDFDSDGTFDQTTTTPTVSHTFSTAYSGLATLRVTDTSGRTALATTHLGITDDGDETPAASDNCPSIDNQGQEDYDQDGVGDMCDDTPGWPTTDADGVTEGFGSVWPFTGFLPPVDNLPTVNLVKAGLSVPVKFKLGGDRGTAILAAGSPTSSTVVCSTGDPVDAVEQTTTSTAGLHYDASTDTYNYVWQTAKAWSGTCRMLTLRLTDGSTHQARFQFK